MSMVWAPPAWWRRVSLCVALVALVGLGGCASFYVDGSTPEVDSAKFSTPAAKRPVQLLFEFQTKGVANARATTALKARVFEQVKASGLFSDVSEIPSADGALLSVTLNNVPLSDDAFSKGFVTGLTFGLAGSKVSDGYVCTAKYLGGGDAPAITTHARHAIHTAIGLTNDPSNATKAANIDAAVTAMTRQVVSNVLYDLSRDPSFQNAKPTR